jgi:hypothetical protein
VVHLVHLARAERRCPVNAATYTPRPVASNGDGSAMKLQFDVGTGELAPDSRFEPMVTSS